ncbi:phytoene desaturase family protein [Amorphus coralli]|uniref:phytoene desaturase family protein n=1 Tax=Amorphus coralli TaxID=340680 RepID=UPI0003807AEF|nr:NAD(P)/FAD-dependent oxidoreductase [Amorphus coralli]
MADTAEFDIVVAGGGHNSLITAAYLAKAGLSCLVLEGQKAVGGNTATDEVTLPGFRHDTCSTAHNLIQASPILRDGELPLGDYGLDYILPDPVVHMPFDDGTSITQWRDIERTAAEFARFSESDAASYKRFIAEYQAVAPIFSAASYTPIGFGPSLAERLAEHPDGAIWQKRIALSAWDIIRGTFEHERVRAFLLWMAMMTMVPPEQAMSGRLAYSLVAGRQRWSWTLPRGGSAALPDALTGYIEANGGAIRTNSWVKRLIVENGRCVGVECADGSVHRARRAVVSTIHVKDLLGMASDEAWPGAFREAVDSWQSGIAMFAAHYASTVPLEFEVGGETLRPSAVGVMPSVDRALQVGSDVARGRVNTDDPPLLVMCSTSADPSRAPDGCHTVKVVGFHPYDLAEGADRWDALKEDVALANLRQLQRFSPALTDETILGRHVKSPLDLERLNPHNWHGSCHGGAQIPAQAGGLRPVAGWAQHRMPIEGLYQTGATTHPGGSVSGGPGRNAAMVLLSDLGMPFPAG